MGFLRAVIILKKAAESSNVPVTSLVYFCGKGPTGSRFCSKIQFYNFYNCLFDFHCFSAKINQQIDPCPQNPTTEVTLSKLLTLFCFSTNLISIDEVKGSS